MLKQILYQQMHRSEGSDEEEEDEPREQAPKQDGRYRSQSLEDAFSKTRAGLFRCKECHLEVSQKNQRAHLMTKHTPGKNFPCSHCDKSYKSRASLKEHTDVHHGHTYFWCGLCQKKFLARRSLTFHKKQNHTA